MRRIVHMGVFTWCQSSSNSSLISSQQLAPNLSMKIRSSSAIPCDFATLKKLQTDGVVVDVDTACPVTLSGWVVVACVTVIFDPDACRAVVEGESGGVFHPNDEV